MPAVLLAMRTWHPYVLRCARGNELTAWVALLRFGAVRLASSDLTWRWWLCRNAQTRALSHPLPVMRAREIDQWARSAQYMQLLERNRQARLDAPRSPAPVRSNGSQRAVSARSAGQPLGMVRVQTLVGSLTSMHSGGIH